jgi:flavorubredoxin
VKNIESQLSASGIKIIQPGLEIQYVPDEPGMKQCYDFGKKIAESIKQGI